MLPCTGSTQRSDSMHGGFNVPNMSGTLTSRNSSMNSVGSGGIQQPTGNVPGGRYASNNIPVALSQVCLLRLCSYIILMHTGQISCASNSVPYIS